MSNEAMEATNVTSAQMNKRLIQDVSENIERSNQELTSLAVSLDEASTDYKKKAVAYETATTMLHDCEQAHGWNSDAYRKMKEVVERAMQEMKYAEDREKTLSARNEMVHTRVREYYDVFTKASVLVAVDEAVSHDDATYKRPRWDAINEVVLYHSKSKVIKSGIRKGEISIAYSDIAWKDLEPIYEPILSCFDLKASPIPSAEVDELYAYLERLIKAFGGTFTGKEAKLLFFIAPILVYVANLFSDVRLLVEESIDGRQVQTNGYFEFVIKRGNKRV